MVNIHCIFTTLSKPRPDAFYVNLIYSSQPFCDIGSVITTAHSTTSPPTSFLQNLSTRNWLLVTQLVRGQAQMQPRSLTSVNALTHKAQ